MGTYRLLLIMQIFSMAYAYSGTVTQEQCSDTDIRETNPKIKNNPELKAHFSSPMDQDSIGWCYGFAAADMVSAAVGTPVSASHLSNMYNERVENSFWLKKGYDLFQKINPKINDGFYEGGFVGMAIKALSKKGKICKESDFPFDQEYQGQMYFLFARLESSKKSARDFQYTDELACQVTSDALARSGFGDVNLTHLSSKITETSVNSIITEVANQRCQEMVKIPELKTKRILKPSTPWGKKRYFRLVNEALEKGKPVSLLFNAKHFSVHNVPHVTTAVARRWKNGRCEYKIRNSWGKSCESYLPGIECNKEEGSFWISDDDIQKHVFITNFIKD